MRLYLIAALLLTLISAPFSASAQSADTAPLKIGALECPDRANPGHWQSQKCQIGDQVRAPVAGLSEWRAGETGKLQQLVLSVNGHQLKNVTPAYYSLSTPGRTPNKETDNTNAAQDPAKTYYLSFFLSHTDENRDNWHEILKRYNPFGTSYVVMEIADKNPGGTYGGISIELKVASNYRIFTAAVVFLIVFLGLIWGAKQGHFLREVGPKADGRTINSFSLASTQMALWFIIIFGSFIYLWMVTGDIDTLTAGVLTLAGISAGTGLTATAITAQNQNARVALATEQAKLTDEVDEMKFGLASLGSEAQTAQKIEIEKKTTRLAEIKTSLEKLPAIPKPNSKANFFSDLLMTEGEVTFSRLQIIGWTLILAVVFLHSVFANLAMPEFSGTLLGLMGISGSTYVGFKFPKPPVEVRPKPTAAT